MSAPNAGAKLISKVYIDFSGASLGATGYTQIIASLPQNTKSIYVENTSGVPVSIGMGAASSEQEIDVTPINSSVSKLLLLNKGMRLAVKSLSGTISTGKMLICLYA